MQLWTKIKNWMNEPVGGWDKFWQREVKDQSTKAQQAVHEACQAYLIKWSIYYHQNKEYNTSECLALEQKVCAFLEDAARKLNK